MIIGGFLIYMYILFLAIEIAMAPKTPPAQMTPQAQTARKAHGNTCAMCDSIVIMLPCLDSLHGLELCGFIAV